MIRKRLMVLGLALVVVLTVAPLAAGAGHGGKHAAKPAKGKPFFCTGKVVSVDPSTGTFIVSVAKGSHNMRAYVGKQVTFTLALHARILARAKGSAYRMVTLDKVTADSQAHINGRLDRSNPSAPVFYAQLVKVVASAPSASRAHRPVRRRAIRQLRRRATPRLLDLHRLSRAIQSGRGGDPQGLPVPDPTVEPCEPPVACGTTGTSQS